MKLYVSIGVAIATAMLAGCSSDEVGNANDSDMSKMIVFSGTTDEETTLKEQVVTRTAGMYNGSKIDFFWTLNDKLWLNDGTSRIVSNSSNITGKQASANFYYGQTFTASSYPVRYTGNNATSGDKVTIKAEQTQSTPADASHIGTDGDCGTATATLTGGVYKFQLVHKAAYVTFLPWYDNEQLSSDVYVKRIKLTADENIAGTYDFDDNGLQTASVTNGSKTITLTLSDQFTIPTAANYTKNAAIMVVAPGTYHNVKVEYLLADKKTGVEGTIVETYPSMIFNSNKNRRIEKRKLSMNNYASHYYRWDATNHYWFNYTGSLPILPNEMATTACNAGMANYQNMGDNNLTGPTLAASHALSNVPNVNEATLYAFFGDSHWDGDIVWVRNGHLYKGGMWFLKLAYIGTGYSHPVGYVKEYSRNYQDNSYWYNWTEGASSVLANGPAWTTNVSHQGRPTTNADRYFFLPAMGYLENDGRLRLYVEEYYGTYWTSTGVLLQSGSSYTKQALCLHFSNTRVGVNIDDRGWGYPVFDATSLQLK